MEYYLATKNNKITPFSGKWIELEITILGKINQTQQDRYCIFFSQMQYLDLKQTTDVNIKGGLFGGVNLWEMGGDQ
jgi:hypothetical protein